MATDGELTMAPLPVLTKNQILVLDALTRTEGPASAYSLLDDGFRAPLQVYRALEKLIEYGLVHRLESLSSFVACAHPHDHADGNRHGLVAFAICEACGRVDEFSDATVEKRLKGWAGDHAFKLSKTTIEIRGTCANCLAQ
jgi:Fur family zinc uptake transcriptional regulator